MKSVVTKPTRLNPDRILDNIITDLSKWYQSPECLPPLDADPGSGGKKSDHLIVVMQPISVLNNKPARTTREILVRPMKQSGINMFGNWIRNQTWIEVYEADSVDKKADILQKLLMDKIDEFLPQKKRIISSDDQPFCSQEMKRLKRLKGREFQKHRRSLKWRVLNYEYKRAVIKAKRKYYKDIIKDLKTSKTSQWYSKLKKLCSHDQKKSEPITVESLKHLTVKEQAEAIADKFCKVSLKKIESIKTNKSVPPGDIPPTLAKMFAKELSSPLCDVINSPIKLGQWSKLYKKESITPVPKVFPPQSPNELRNISGLLLFNKIAEGLIAELMISDISGQLDPSQYANQKGISLQHYLINMISKILSDTE